MNIIANNQWLQRRIQNPVFIWDGAFSSSCYRQQRWIENMAKRNIEVFAKIVKVEDFHGQFLKFFHCIVVSFPFHFGCSIEGVLCWDTDWPLGQITLTSKNACWPVTQNPLDFISTLASLLVLAVRFSNVSPITGRSCGSISTSLHTSVSRFAVKSQRSLCLIVMNPPFLQLIACWMSILDPQLHVDGMFVNFQS